MAHECVLFLMHEIQLPPKMCVTLCYKDRQVIFGTQAPLSFMPYITSLIMKFPYVHLQTHTLMCPSKNRCVINLSKLNFTSIELPF